MGALTKDRLYRISKKLYSEKEQLEEHFLVLTYELFDIFRNIQETYLFVSKIWMEIVFPSSEFIPTKKKKSGFMASMLLRQEMARSSEKMKEH